MANTNTTAPNWSPVIMQAYDATSLAVSCLADLFALFSAIKASAPEHSDIHRLSNLGQFATEHYLGAVEYECGELKKMLPK